MFKAASKRVLVRTKVGAWKVDENILKNRKILTGKLATPTNPSKVIYKLRNVATEIATWKTSQSWNISPERNDMWTLTKTKESRKSGKNICTLSLVSNRRALSTRRPYHLYSRVSTIWQSLRIITVRVPSCSHGNVESMKLSSISSTKSAW